MGRRGKYVTLKALDALYLNFIRSVRPFSPRKVQKDGRRSAESDHHFNEDRVHSDTMLIHEAAKRARDESEMRMMLNYTGCASDEMYTSKTIRVTNLLTY